MALVYQGENPETIFSKRNQSFIKVSAGSSQELLAEAKELGLNIVSKETEPIVVTKKSASTLVEEKPEANGKG